MNELVLILDYNLEQKKKKIQKKSMYFDWAIRNRNIGCAESIHIISLYEATFIVALGEH